MSITIPLSKEQLEKFISSLPEIGLEWSTAVKETWPLDFTLIYKKRFIVHFEYLSGDLELFIIGIIEKGIRKQNLSKQEMEKYDNMVLPEIEKKIMGIVGF